MNLIDIEGLSLGALDEVPSWDFTVQEAFKKVPYYMGSYKLKVSLSDERVFHTYYHPKVTEILLQDVNFPEGEVNGDPVLWVSFETLEHNAQFARDTGIESAGAWDLLEVSFNNRRMALADLHKKSL